MGLPPTVLLVITDPYPVVALVGVRLLRATVTAGGATVTAAVLDGAEVPAALVARMR